MPWHERLRPVSMRRIAVVAAPGRMRDALVVVAGAGCVQLDRPNGAELHGAADTLDADHLGPGAGETARGSEAHELRPALCRTAPDLEMLRQTGRTDLLAGEAQLRERMRAEVRRGPLSAVAGWCPDRRVGALAGELSAVGAALVTVRPPRGIDPPTMLSDDKQLHRAASPLIRTYGTVPYADIDPTLAAGAAYVLMFGIMFGDVGHGLLLLAAAAVIRSGRLRRLARLRPMWPFVAAAGAAAALAGLLYGEFFGPTGAVPALWLNPLDDPVRLLVAAIAVGCVLLAVAYGFGAVNRWREAGPGRALYAASGVAGAALFLGLVLLILGVVRHLPPLAVAGGAAAAAGTAAVAVGLFSAAGGGGSGAAQAGVEVFDTVVRTGSGVVSFSRLAAFGLAHAALGAVVWRAASGLWHHGPALVAAAVLVFALGNAVTFALEALVAGVQALRLEFYELFSRVFDIEGRPFRPWSLPVRPHPEVSR